MSDLDLRERAELCDLLAELGPDAPTLCDGWTTAHLAAHLVVRERDPLSAVGILVPRFADATERRMAERVQRDGYEELVRLVRTGPPLGPMKIPGVRPLVNTVEFFVHHEDVRRANGHGPRADREDLQAALWSLLGRMLGLMVRKAGVPDVRIEVAAPDGRTHGSGKGSRTVTITGEPAELVLELYGRRGAAQVTYDGPDDAVAAVRAAEFGI